MKTLFRVPKANRTGRGRTFPSHGIALVALVALAPACAGPEAEGEQEEGEVSEHSAALNAEPAGAAAASTDTPTSGAGRPLWEALEAERNRMQPARAAAGTPGDSINVYSAKCDIATRTHVPAFNCDVGTSVPGQGTIPATDPDVTKCDRPNLLNKVCDPGSKFQVLVKTADAVVVGHCRKDGLPVAGSNYNDIAVIQYNKTNGALCFYQALGYDDGPLPGANVRPPAEGPSAWRWLTPTTTEGINCTGCHDNGGLIRSNYLSQLTSGPNALPSTADGYTNQTSPIRFVGADFVTNRSWSITTAPAACPPGDTCLPCTTCHRLAVNNYKAFGIINGTAGNFANVATAATQLSKNPHSASSPIWMRPGQITYKAEAEANATRFKNCATGFWSGKSDGFTSGTATAGCTFTPLGTTWTGISPAKIMTAATQTIML